ncbi:hypothetical protein [Carboxylicivirga sp. M1479]|uniref:hypothetical protein n=1 Tax=Carboxylicivirga sp. M1479 TaxID=2594476 RepID=UPI0011780E1A|nr:hypothetical protein [Carboxylicivirga sp. M1479]TRX72291.1 hypothetical protein FNN09_02645 [Carboxylicivirga sp. M1479]
MIPFSTEDKNQSFDDTSELKRPFNFSYDLSAVGQVKGTISTQDQIVEFHLHNNTNPLIDLLKGMINLVFEPSHIWGEDNISWVDWYEEEGGIKWVLSTEDGLLVRIKIIRYEDFFDESTGKLVLDTALNLLDFYYVVVHRLDILIKKEGLLNYEQKWQKDEFPFTYFLLLKKHLIEKGHWISTKERLGPLSDEIDFLLT